MHSLRNWSPFLGTLFGLSAAFLFAESAFAQPDISAGATYTISGTATGASWWARMDYIDASSTPRQSFAWYDLLTGAPCEDFASVIVDSFNCYRAVECAVPPTPDYECAVVMGSPCQFTITMFPPATLTNVFVSDDQVNWCTVTTTGCSFNPSITLVDVATGNPPASLAPAFRLGTPSPNPFNPTVILPYESDVATQVNTAIYDLRGNLVRVLHRGLLAAGHQSWRWDGKDATGTNVASGIFVLRVVADGETQTRKLALVR